MPLARNTPIGQYKIVALIGAGGMGEVYRARDSHLNRDVALKIIPDLFARDSDRLLRLKREAQLLASLNHPNIASIHGLEETGETTALVLELIDGPTLADRLVEGPIPVREALVIARQIAEALEAAHEADVVHRDLKPANIKLRPDGHVKVLDFGIAKVLDGDSANVGGGSMLTPTPTATGLIIGTAAYMSPEQARGRVVDKRSDIWAFGAVLFEMLAGKRAFDGNGETTDTLAAVLKDEPNWRLLPASLPRAVGKLLHRCLEKDRARRLRDIGDARLEIEEAIAGGGDADIASAARGGGRWREVLAWSTAVALAVTIGVVVAATWLDEAQDAAAITRTHIVLEDELDLAFRAAPLALSRDGRRLVYGAERQGRTQLFVRDLTELGGTPLTGTVGASQPFFSPDGEWVGFFARGMLQRIAVGGGTPLQISPVEGATFGGAWTDDDRIVFATHAGLHVLPTAGGMPRPLPDTMGGRWPESLPGSATVLFTTNSADEGEIRSLSLDDGVQRTLARTGSAAGDVSAPVIGPGALGPVRFVPPGHLVFGHGSFRVRAASFDSKSLRLTGSPVSVVDFVYRSAEGGPVYFAVSASGTLVYAPEDPRRRLVWVERSGRATPIGSDLEAFRYPRLSPNGRDLAINISTEERRSDIWIYDTVRGTRTRMTSERSSLLPLWHPTLAEIVFSEGNTIVQQRADAGGGGGGGGQTILTTPQAAYPMTWSPDGRTLVFVADTDLNGHDLMEVSPGTQGARPLLARPFNDHWARLAPDGNWLAYASDSSGIDEVYVVRYPEMTDHTRVSTEGGTWPVWAPDGRALYYRQGNAVMGVSVATASDIQLGVPELLFTGPYIGVDGARAFDLAPDGQRFLMIERVDAAAARQLVVVQNWSTELARLAPAPSR